MYFAAINNPCTYDILLNLILFLYLALITINKHYHQQYQQLNKDWMNEEQDEFEDNEQISGYLAENNHVSDLRIIYIEITTDKFIEDQCNYQK